MKTYIPAPRHRRSDFDDMDWVKRGCPLEAGGPWEFALKYVNAMPSVFGWMGWEAVNDARFDTPTS